MRIRVILYSVLRQKLPADQRGQTTVTLPENGTVRDVFAQLDLPETAAWAVNGSMERDLSRSLMDGDELRVFRAGAGGD